MVSNDHDYYNRRAEREMAQRTDKPAAVKAHSMLASYYLDRIASDSQAATEPQRT